MSKPVFGLQVAPLPKWEDFQNLPDRTKGPVTIAEEQGRQHRRQVDQQIVSNMQAAQQRVRMHYGPLLTQGVNVWA